MESVLELANVAINKNTVPGDKSAFIPGGIRIGTPALTTRGFVEADFEQVAEFIHRGVVTAKAINESGIGKKLADFKAAIKSQDWPEINSLRGDVVDFASKFPTIGFDESSMKYP